MNKSELVDRLAPHLGGRAAATQAVDLVVDAVIREVSAGGTVGITGFGTFERVDRAPRTGRNPRTGEVVPIHGTSTPRFRPGTYFKSVVADPTALPGGGLAGGRAGAGSGGGTRARSARTSRRRATGSGEDETAGSPADGAAGSAARPSSGADPGVPHPRDVPPHEITGRLVASKKAQKTRRGKREQQVQDRLAELRAAYKQHPKGSKKYDKGKAAYRRARDAADG